MIPFHLRISFGGPMGLRTNEGPPGISQTSYNHNFQHQAAVGCPWHCKLSIDLVVLKIQPRTRIPFFERSQTFFTQSGGISGISQKYDHKESQSWCSASIAIEVVPSEEPITAFQVQQSHFHQWRELLNLFFAQHWLNNKIISTNVQNNIPILPFLVMTPFFVGNHQKSLHISIAHQPVPYKTTTRVGLWPSGS